MEATGDFAKNSLRDDGLVGANWRRLSGTREVKNPRIACVDNSGQSLTVKGQRNGGGAGRKGFKVLLAYVCDDGKIRERED